MRQIERKVKTDYSKNMVSKNTMKIK